MWWPDGCFHQLRPLWCHSPNPWCPLIQGSVLNHKCTKKKRVHWWQCGVCLDLFSRSTTNSIWNHCWHSPLEILWTLQTLWWCRADCGPTCVHVDHTQQWWGMWQCLRSKTENNHRSVYTQQQVSWTCSIYSVSTSQGELQWAFTTITNLLEETEHRRKKPSVKQGHKREEPNDPTVDPKPNQNRCMTSIRPLLWTIFLSTSMKKHFEEWGLTYAVLTTLTIVFLWGWGII